MPISKFKLIEIIDSQMTVSRKNEEIRCLAVLKNILQPMPVLIDMSDPTLFLQDQDCEYFIKNESLIDLSLEIRDSLSEAKDTNARVLELLHNLVEKLSKTEKNLRIEEILGTRSSSSSESEVNTPKHPFDDTPTATPRGFLEEEASQALQILRAQGGR